MIQAQGREAQVALHPNFDSFRNVDTVIEKSVVEILLQIINHRGEQEHIKKNRRHPEKENEDKR